MKKKTLGVVALIAAGALGLVGCTDGDGGTGGGSANDMKSISIGYVSGWTDGQSMAYLYKNQFEKLGYDVKIETLADNGPLYAGVAGGDIDVFASAAPETMQADYWEEFGDDIEDIVTWYSGMQNLLAVPSYSKMKSVEDLKGNADLFNGEIIGIEPGAGLTQMTEESLIPKYGLEGEYTLLTSSTASMLTALGEAIKKKQEIVVTLWKPFWAMSAYDVRVLEDPLGGMADPEGVHSLARTGFTKEYPDLVKFMEGVKLDDESYGALETLIVDPQFENNSEGAVEAWLDKFPDAFSTVVKN